MHTTENALLAGNTVAVSSTQAASCHFLVRLCACSRSYARKGTFLFSISRLRTALVTYFYSTANSGASQISIIRCLIRMSSFDMHAQTHNIKPTVSNIAPEIFMETHLFSWCMSSSTHSYGSATTTVLCCGQSPPFFYVKYLKKYGHVAQTVLA